MKNNRINVRVISFVAILGALSFILMLFRFPLPFAPGFLELDISELPALFTGFFLGPIAGCLVVLVKILLKIVIQWSGTMLIGELSNFILSCVAVLVSSLIYKYNRTLRGAIISLIATTLAVSLVSVATNTFFIFPMYAKVMGKAMDDFVALASAVNPLVKGVSTMMWFSVFPFNIIKYTLTSVVTFLIYRRSADALKKILIKN